MAIVARRTATRSNAEPSKDKTKTKVIIPEDTKANITEQIGAKTVSYEAEVIEDKENENEEFENETIDSQSFLRDSETEAEEIPKSQIEKMFDDIATVNKNNNSFFASVVRMPDGMNDRFNYPCSMQMTLGSFQFTARDKFSFVPAIQKMNGHSGGIFNVLIYTQDGQPLEAPRVRNFITVYAPVGVKNLYIQNPVQQETKNGNDTTGLGAVLIEMQKMQQESNRQILDALNKRQQKSELEKAIEQKVLNDIMNPTQKDSNDFNMEKIMANVFGSVAVMNAMGDGFAKMINRQPPAAPEPTTWDNVQKVLDNPMAQNVISKFLDVGDAIAVKYLEGSAGVVETQEEIIDGEPNEMQILITRIIEELETENPIDTENKMIKDLQEQYGSHADTLKITCKTLDFNNTLNMLMTMTGKMQPYPFLPFIDIEQTQKQKVTVFNERGNKIVNRLQEFYVFVRSQD